jgi:predicted alpha/beta-fold hydrolase
LPLLWNGHLQTALGFAWKGRPFRKPTTQQLVTMPDGDRLVLHDSRPPQWRSGSPIALLLHGLGGSSRSGYMQRVAATLYPRGVRVVRLDLRGTGAGFGLARNFYHAGRTEDIRAALLELHRDSPTSPLLVLGFSLGGNLALKLAGEAAADPVPMLTRVAVVAPPIDILRCSELISRPQLRFYDRFFARSMIKLAKERSRHHPDPPLPRFPPNPSVRIFDDLFTAPRCGFLNALDYYRKASSFPLIAQILIPTLIITARDDPFVAVEAFEELRVPPHVRVEIHERGGHLGFLGFDGTGGVRWAERRMVEWVLKGSD